MLTLFPYQESIYTQTVGNLNEPLSVLAATTGAGKTTIATKLIQDHPKQRFLILSHNQNILRSNFSLTLERYGVAHTCLESNKSLRRASRSRVVVTLFATIYRNIETLGTFDVIIVDEAHQFTGPDNLMWKRIKASNPNARILYLTASHYSIQSEAKTFFSREEAMDAGQIHPNTKITIQESKIKVRDEDYNVEHELKDSVTVVGDVGAVKELLKTYGTPALIQCHNATQAEKMLAGLKSRKRSVEISTAAEDVDSEVLERFKAGGLDIAIVLKRATLGFDMPELKTYVDASYSRNVQNIEQAFGRVLRKHPENEVRKAFVKLSPFGFLEETTAVLGAVVGLSTKEMYSTWDGNYKTPRTIDPADVASRGDSSSSEAGGNDSNVAGKDRKLCRLLSIDFSEYIELFKTHETRRLSDMLNIVRGRKGNTVNNSAYKKQLIREFIATHNRAPRTKDDLYPCWKDYVQRNSGTFDPLFYNEFKTYVREGVNHNKTRAKLLQYALEFGRKPPRRHPLYYAWLRHTNSENLYFDAEFYEKIKHVDSSRKVAIAEAKKELLEYVKTRGQLPPRNSKLGRYCGQFLRPEHTEFVKELAKYDPLIAKRLQEKSQPQSTRPGKSICCSNGVTYPSLREAARALDISVGGISSVAKSLMTQTKGYRFWFVDESPENEKAAS